MYRSKNDFMAVPTLSPPTPNNPSFGYNVSFCGMKTLKSQ